MDYEPVVGLEIHAELATKSKMFCACQVLDSTQAAPNTAVCPVCAGMPGVLPVVNQKAVEYALRVALALECQVANTSIFARKNYFYPDLPKGYQISQYEQPLAEHGRLKIRTSSGERYIRIHRVHMEEDAGKLTHVEKDGQNYSLVDLNRAGVPLLEIVSEPDMFTVEEVRAYAEGIRAIVRAVGVNSGDMEKGVIRFEANISIKPVGSSTLGTRVEIKNLNSFRALERGVAYEVERQTQVLNSGGTVNQETRGWNEAENKTYTQRSKEEAHDYRYFPEPDLPPLVVEDEWIKRVRQNLPELPGARQERFEREYQLAENEAHLLAVEKPLADYFEKSVRAGKNVSSRTISNWILGEVFAWMNQNNVPLEQLKVSPENLAALIQCVESGQINLNTGKNVLGEMLESGAEAAHIIQSRGLQQISDSGFITELVSKTLAEHPTELNNYLGGKETLSNWFFGQVMRQASGKANPQMLRSELERQLAEHKQKG